MIKVTLAQLNHQPVANALSSLVKMKLDPTVGYRVDRIMKHAGPAFLQSRKYQESMYLEHCNLDDKGQPKINRPEGLPAHIAFDGHPDFKSEEDAKAFDEKMRKYFEETILELKVHPIPFDSCEGLTAEQVGALADVGLLSGVPDEA